MALQDIQNRLREWKADDMYKHSKSFREFQSKMVTGEYDYVLSWRLSLNPFGIAEPIVQTRTFHTQTLVPEQLSDKPDGDLHRLNQLFPMYDNEFLQKVEDAYTRRIQELNPGGFF